MHYRPRSVRTLALGFLISVFPDLVFAQEEGATPALPEPAPEAENPEEQAAPTPEEIAEKFREMEERLRVLEQANLDGSPLAIHGYVDFGVFVPNGNAGIGWIRDVGNAQFPQYSNYSWTFLGDILATTINSRGEVADVGDAPGIERFDSVDSFGAPGFLVNEVNFRVDYALSSRAFARSSVNFIPRSSNLDFAIGDFLDVDLAELELVATKDGGTSIFAGKMLPVFGIEYKDRRADQRFGVTPSLLHRYTSGSQLGVKVRSKLFRNWLILAASVTNNTSTTEQFHFYREVDSNSGKTLNGRIAVNVPIGDFISTVAGDSLEIGVSGEWGPQDRATNNKENIWFAGVDLTYTGSTFAIKGQWMRGEAPGSSSERVWGLKLNDSGYVEIDWLVVPYVGVLARAEFRDAVVTLGTERLYLTKSMRFTGGAKLVFNSHVALKAEYLHNREYGGIEEFPNDVFVSSLVLSY